MRSTALAFSLILTPFCASADMVDDILDQQILPGMETLASTSTTLARAAKADCRSNSTLMRRAYDDAFDAWMMVSHFRFGPTETDNRAFALSFWPDSRGKIPKALSALVRNQDPVINTPEDFATASIAARGFYAMDYLLYNSEITGASTAEYHCNLFQAITADIANTAQLIHNDWQASYADQLRSPGDRYQTEGEVKQELYKALNTGLQVTADMRLGRPLGTFDKPRPKRAEARRSRRSQRHVALSLQALKPLAIALSVDNVALADKFHLTFAKAHKAVERLDDPIFASVADPADRFRVEALQQLVNDIRAIADTELGPSLGVDPGFNSLDGD
ncbi:peptidase M75 [Sedimentitalea sp. CY04]|uniref:Peptidase M75 n=1 Tax=Parasedimentitalea denitrificans TaxID=2211118 RepID=A0ABX0W2M9_9RHOB|nr:imelysin family protein [Sedimentitalea sp. CY04]NIZ59676.1 peptidase M75 [Sedimentitalea sp. CY04]